MRSEEEPAASGFSDVKSSCRLTRDTIQKAMLMSWAETQHAALSVYRPPLSEAGDNCSAILSNQFYLF